MSRVVLDSSAVLASLYNEAGTDLVDAMILGASISAVNAAEVISKLVERGMTAANARSVLIQTGVEILPFDLDQAERVGELRNKTRAHGLSLGDRACLALAQSINGRVVTADRSWGGVKDLGIELFLFRESL